MKGTYIVQLPCDPLQVAIDEAVGGSKSGGGAEGCRVDLVDG